ncbi:MAG: threonine synthase [Spirochaetia bacterium]
MRLQSTRHKAAETTFTHALFTGLAPDGGLYHPLEIPDLRSLFASWDKTASFCRIAEQVSHVFLDSEVDAELLSRIIKRAFDFSPALRRVDERISLLELFHGPSFAFKDFGACFLASFMEEILAEENKHAVILVATSGDTGSAVARAFFKKKNIDVVILFPKGRVSYLQEKQLTTLGANVHALEVEGSFDDCQRMVKESFGNSRLRAGINLTSANSINIGRLFPQSFYYIYAYTRLRQEIEGDLLFCVPSGNFGNLTAGIYAWCWGLPVSRFIAATNINDVVPEYLEHNVFSPRASMHTLSNAMDVGNPSNFERMQEIFGHDHDAMVRMIHGEVVNDTQTMEQITEFYKQHGLFIDPHTAVGYLAARRVLAAGGVPLADGRVSAGKPPHIVCLATAHPAKFRETLKQATGHEPELPEGLAQAMHLPKQSIEIKNDSRELADFLLQKFS